MSDIPSTWPDNSAVLQQIKAPFHYEQKVWAEYGNPCFEVWKAILKVKDKNITLITNPEKYSELQNTKQQKEALSEDFKQKFIKKLKEKTDNKLILEAIEKWTLKVFKTPLKKWYKLDFDDKWYAKQVETPSIQRFTISLQWDNLDFILNVDWSIYFNFTSKRENLNKKAAFNWFTWIEEKNINWVNYIIKDWKKYEVFTKEYYDILLEELLKIDNFSKLLMSIDFDKLQKEQ